MHTLDVGLKKLLISITVARKKFGQRCEKTCSAKHSLFRGTSDWSVEQLESMQSDLLQCVKEQVEYYFSSQNLASDSYLVSRMDAQMFVPLDVILGFAKIQQLTSDGKVILEAIKDSKVGCWFLQCIFSGIDLCAERAKNSSEAIATVEADYHYHQRYSFKHCRMQS